MNVISATNLAFHVNTAEGKLDLLSEISLEIKSGETIAIIGRSGAGKTTLLSILAGFLNPTSGALTVLGKDFITLTEHEKTKLRGQEIGFIFQDFFLIQNLTVLENVCLGLNIHGIPNATAKALAMLETMGLHGKDNLLPQVLSQGEQQRVAIARSLVLSPTILFADEPTGNLDVETGDIIMRDIFTTLKAAGKTLVLITHDLELAKKCSKIYKINKGKIVDA